MTQPLNIKTRDDSNIMNNPASRVPPKKDRRRPKRRARPGPRESAGPQKTFRGITENVGTCIYQ